LNHDDSDALNATLLSHSAAGGEQLRGIRNKAARGELRRDHPVGFVWGEKDGEVRFHPDEAVCTAIRTVFAKFNELGSVRRVWLWLRSEGLSFPSLPGLRGGNALVVRPLHRYYSLVRLLIRVHAHRSAFAFMKRAHYRALAWCTSEASCVI
jgi:hypothetical protein